MNNLRSAFDVKSFCATFDCTKISLQIGSSFFVPSMTVVKLDHFSLLASIFSLLIAVLLNAQPAQARYEFSVQQNIPYVQKGDKAQVGDLYIPVEESDKIKFYPAVIYIHGGGWSGGDKKQSTPMAAELAANGFVVYNINYRLVGKGGEFPADVEDVKDALAFMGTKATEWHINTNRIAAMGASAGGHLSMLLGYTDDRVCKAVHYPNSKVKVKAVASWCGPAYFTPGEMDVVDDYMRKAGKKAYPIASPRTYISSAVPTIFVHGTDDELVTIKGPEKLHADLQKKGIYSEFVPLKGEGHGFSVTGWQEGMKRTIDFLNKRLALTK